MRNGDVQNVQVSVHILVMNHVPQLLQVLLVTLVHLVVRALVVEVVLQHAREVHSLRLVPDAQIVVVEIVRKVVVTLVATIVRHHVKTHHLVAGQKIMIEYHLPQVVLMDTNMWI